VSSLVVRDVVGLAGIFDKAINVGLLERSLSPSVASYARVLASEGAWSFKGILDAGQGTEDACRHLADALPPAPGRDELCADVAFWMEVLAELTGVNRIGVRLVRLDAPMCPSMHVDKVTLRVVSTYAGAGTEWMSAGSLRRCREGDVVLLKGERWPGNEGRGAVHRSPPLEAGARAGARVLLTLDPLA
jgi:hypothetical protein